MSNNFFDTFETEFANRVQNENEAEDDIPPLSPHLSELHLSRDGTEQQTQVADVVNEPAEGLGLHEEPRERDDPDSRPRFPKIQLGLPPRRKIIVKPGQLASTVVKKSRKCLEAYNIAKEWGYYMPPYRERCVTYNYAIGIFQKEYYAPFGTVEPWTYPIPKITKYALYCELTKMEPQLGYDSSNLPNKRYLLEVLRHLCPAHFIFVNDLSRAVIPTGEDGTFMIPESLRGLIKTEVVLSRDVISHKITGGLPYYLKELNKWSSVVCKAQRLRDLVGPLKKQIQTVGYLTMTPEYEKMQRIFARAFN